MAWAVAANSACLSSSTTTAAARRRWSAAACASRSATCGTLLVAAAGSVGYGLPRALSAAGQSFWGRLSSRAPWDVPDKSTWKRQRWRNAGPFSAPKRAPGGVNLASRTAALVHREPGGSRRAVQRLLGQAALALRQAGAPRRLPSPRQIWLAIRAEVRNPVGIGLGPRPRRTGGPRLQRARGDARRRRANDVRRPWPGRTPYRPPGAPKILAMGGDLEHLMEKTLGVV